MLFLFLTFLCAGLAAYFYFYRPVTLGEKLGVKEKTPDVKKYYELEIPVLGEVNYFKRLSQHVKDHGAHAAPSHLGFVSLSGGLLGFILGIMLFQSLFLAFASFLLLFLAGSRLYASWLINNQREKISKQLGGVILSLASSLRAGKTLIDAIGAVSEEAPSPLGPEFGRIYDAVKHGGEDLNSALKKMLVRSGNHHMLEKVVLAMTITRQAGGNIAGALEGVGRMLDDENYTKEFTKSHTSHGKIVAVTFNAIAILVLWNINRAMDNIIAQYYLSNFKGQLIFFACVCLIAGGWVAIYKMLSSVHDT